MSGNTSMQDALKLAIMNRDLVYDENDRLRALNAELLAALELLLDRVNCGHQRNGPSMIAAREVARAATAKAKGEAP